MSHLRFDAFERGPQNRAVVGVSVFLITALGLSLRLAFVGQESLWFDEAWSWRYAHLSIRALWIEALDLHPPLYYTLQHLWLTFGESEAAIRSLSVIFGTASIPLVYLLGSSFADRRTGLISALLTATSALQVAFSQEARSYSLLTMMGLLVNLAMVQFLRLESNDRAKTLWVGLAYVLAILAALYTHYIAALLFVLAGVFGLLRAIQIGSIRMAGRWLGLNGLVLLGWAWWLPTVISQAQGSVLGWRAPLTPGTAFADLRVVFGEPLIWHFPAFADLLLPSLAAIGIALVWRKGLSALYLAAVALSIPAAEIAIDVAGKAIFGVRTIEWLAPIYLIFAAVPLSRLRAILALPLLALVVGIQFNGVYHYYVVPATGYAFPHEDEPWRDVVSDLALHLCDGDVVLLSPKSMDPPFSYYFRQHARGGITVLGIEAMGSGFLSDPRLVRVEAVNTAGIETISESANRIWLVGRQWLDAASAEELSKLREQLLRGRRMVYTHVDRNLRTELLTKGSGLDDPGCQLRPTNNR